MRSVDEMIIAKWRDSARNAFLAHDC